MNQRAIILAAGRGSRLHPYTEGMPKCRTELAGIALIDRQIATLQVCGIDDIVIVTGYRREDLALPGTREVHNPAWAETNMVESLFCAKDLFTDDVIVSYSDIVYNAAVLEALLTADHPSSVIVDTAWRSYWAARFENPEDDAETLKIGPDGCITDIGNPIENIDDVEGQYIGLMRFQRDGIRDLIETREALGKTHRAWMDRRPLAQAYMTDLLTEMILKEKAPYAVPVDAGWLEIDTVSDLDLAQNLFKDNTVVRPQ